MKSYVLQVEKLVWRGRALARLPEGKVVLLGPGAFPGEVVQARVEQEKKDHLLARVQKILEASPWRRVHPCPRSGVCGGCVFGALPQRQQLEQKKQIVQDTLRRQLRQTEHIAEQLTIQPSRPAWRYRWRGQIQVKSGLPHVYGLQGSGLVYSPDCLLYSPPLGRGLLDLASRLEDGRHTVAASPWDLQLKSGSDPGLLQLPVHDFQFCLQVPPGSFFQANWKLNQSLTGLICDRLKTKQRIADLYCGAGNFALPLGLQGAKVLALDRDQRSVETGQENALRLGLDNVRFCSMNLRKKMPSVLEKFRPEALVVDPPRSGAGRALEKLHDLKSLQSMVWVSCDLVNTCRDLNFFLARGWGIRDIIMFDMFPQSWHLELVLFLERGE